MDRFDSDVRKPRRDYVKFDGMYSLFDHNLSELRLVCQGLCVESSLLPLLGRAADYAGCKKVSVVLKGRDGSCYTAAALGIGDEYVGISTQDPSRVSAQAMDYANINKRPVFIDFRQPNPRLNSKTAYESDMYMGFPLFSDDNKVIGILNATDFKQEPHSGTLDVLTFIADFISRTVSRTKWKFKEAHGLLRAIDMKDHYTAGHCARVSMYSDLIAGALRLPKRDRFPLKTYGKIHDLGKIGVSDRVLQKEGRLDDEEYAEMRMHVDKGIDVLGDESSDAAILGHHHERWDGKGYSGRVGWEIDSRARVLSCADAFDAMTTDRSYRFSMPLDDALAEIERNAGAQFDPSVADCFLRIAADAPERIMEIMVCTGIQ